MTRWLQCPAALIVPLLALVLFLRSESHGPSETAPPAPQGGERLLLRRTPSTSEEGSNVESTALPRRLAAEQKSVGSGASETVQSNSPRPTQPLPGTQLDPASYSIDPARRSEPPAGRPSSLPPDAASRERASSVPPKRTPTRRTFVKHRVVDGDDLRNLARRYLKDANRALEIFHANRDVLEQPDLLPLGVELQIPVALP